MTISGLPRLMPPNSTSDLSLSLVGGASGVGKTTLIDSIGDTAILDTGSLFKRYLNVVSRDDIRKSNWSFFEADVAQDLTVAILQSLSKSSRVIVDTHFAAKISSRAYRIGLKPQLTYTLAKSVFDYADTVCKFATLRVVLISCDPHALLARRRQDPSRDRELVPSDCYNALRANKVRSLDYVREAMRARGNDDHSRVRHRVDYTIVENRHSIEAMQTLHRLVTGEIVNAPVSLDKRHR